MAAIDRSRNAARSEGGFALLLVFMLASAIAITFYMELPRVAFESQRLRENLTVDRAQQYKRAIQIFVRANKRYPSKIEDLESFNDKRYLRRRFVDPLTGKDDWRAIHVGPMGQLTDSLVKKQNANPLGGKDDKSGQDQLASSTTPDPNDPNNPNNPNSLGGSINFAKTQRPSDKMAGTLPPMGTTVGGQPGQPGYPQQQYPGQYPTQQYPNPTAGIVQPGQPLQTYPGQINPQTGQPYQPAAPAINPATGQPYPSNVAINPQTGQPYPGQIDPNTGMPYQNSGQPVQMVRVTPSQPYTPNQPYTPGGINPNPGGIPVPGGIPGANNSIPNGVPQQIQDQLMGQRQTPPGVTGIAGAPQAGGLGAGIAGFGIPAEYKGEGIMLIGERSKYREWEFVYDPKEDKTVVGAAAAAQNQSGGNALTPGTTNSGTTQQGTTQQSTTPQSTTQQQ